MAPGWGWFQIPAIQPLEQSQPKGSSLRMGIVWLGRGSPGGREGEQL